jgi:endonuclease/exonuclease/phosphatase family metal-dependent hydrolase
MSKHAGSGLPEGGGRGVTIATIVVVALLGLVVSMLAVLGLHDDKQPDVVADAAADASPTAESTETPSEPPTSAPQSSSPASQRPRTAPTFEPQRIGEAGKALRRKTQSALASRAEQQQDAVEEPAVAPTSFRVATFNVLGDSHTRPGGNKRGWASGTTRMGWATSVIQGSGADVVGLQELEIAQARTFIRRAGGGWDLFPGPAGGTLTVRNSIAWRTGDWERVSTRTVPIPYFHGNRVPMPVVELRNRESGQNVYFINVHNPATTSRHGNNAKWRSMAMSIELNLVRELRAKAPVVITGDFNERAQAICRMTSGGHLRAAAYAGVASGCAAPRNSGIDWIFGTPEMGFSGYNRHRSGLVSKATDHPFVISNALISPEAAPEG